MKDEYTKLSDRSKRIASTRHCQLCGDVIPFLSGRNKFCSDRCVRDSTAMARAKKNEN